MRLRAVAVISVVLVATTAASASAQPREPTPVQLARARRAFDQARIDFDAGRFEVALDGFGRAYRITGSPELLYNIGVCHDRLRRDREALAAFEEYLERVEDPEDRQFVERRIEALRRSLDASVPTPEETAESAGGLDGPIGPDPVDPGTDDGGSVLGRWWFWTIAGVVVAGAVVGVVLARGGETAPLVTGDDGMVIETLRLR